MQGAVLGLPIQLISRMAGIASGALGSTAGTVMKYGVTAGLMLGAVAPYLGKDLADEGQSKIGDMLSSLVSFMDLNASHIKTINKKRVSVLDIPGRQNDWLQDMGRKSTVYKLKGKFFAMDSMVQGLQTSALSAIFQALYGDAAVGNCTMLTQLTNLGVPVPFMNKLDISEVFIADAIFDQRGGRPNYVEYDITLVEYRKYPLAGKLGALAAASLLGRV